MINQLVLILDFGSQYTQLIARTTRKLGVYSEILPYNAGYEEIVQKKPKAIILSGSPFSVNDAKAPIPDKRIFELDVPVLGICYGMQLLTHLYGGKVAKSRKKGTGTAQLSLPFEEPSEEPQSTNGVKGEKGGEYGNVTAIIDTAEVIFGNLSEEETVWMSHTDLLTDLPDDFISIAETESTPFAAIRHIRKPFWGLQFHPEVAHTPNGHIIFESFLKDIAGFKGNWTAASFVESSIELIKQTVGNRKVLLALSGGVDSSVTAALLDRAIGENLVAVYVDTGLMRKEETAEIKKLFDFSGGNDAGSFQKHFKLITIDASGLFYERLSGISEPEQKRKIIGNTFIEVFEKEALNHTDIDFLAQGTLYPDVIESVSFKGPSATIKSHHNVGGLPEKMNLKIIEPLRELFKDEVREVGKQLGLPENLIKRHPFPGPGLAVRILGEVSPEKVTILQEIDHIFIAELKLQNLYDEVWQAFSVLLPVRSVGVMGDERTYDYVCALRAVCSTDGMTADWAELPAKFLKRVSNRIINEVSHVNRVVYDISSKPPATIEWE